MSPLLLLSLFLAVIPTILAQQVPVNKCVEIRNRQVDKYLVASSNHDADRRNIGKDRKGHQWIITTDAMADRYRIKHVKLEEELYESAQQWNGNYVFTWIPKQHIGDGGASWIIREVEPQFFEIKNYKFDHCLYTSEWTTWIGAYGECKGHQYQWQFLPVECPKEA